MHLKNLLIVYGIIIFLSCVRSRDPVIIFFKEIDEKISDEDKIIADSCEYIECYFYFLSKYNTDNKELIELLDTLPPQLIMKLDSMNIHSYKAMILFIAYCKYRVSGKYDLVGIKNEIDSYYLNFEDRRRKSSEAFRAYLTKIADKNYNLANINDTITISNNVEFENGKWRSYPWDIGISNEDLKLKCKVIKKWETKYPNDTSDGPIYGLVLKIISLNRRPCEFQFKDIDKDSIISIDIYGYRHEILKEANLFHLHFIAPNVGKKLFNNP